ncbi:MAG: two-component system sensor histidine kinase NtrB [Gemmatimonadaceae bacterium]
MQSPPDEHTPHPIGMSRATAPVPVIPARALPRSVPPWVVAALGIGSGSLLTAAVALRERAAAAEITALVGLVCTALVIVACFRTWRVIHIRRVEKVRTQAHTGRVAGLLESARGLTAQNSEPAVYEQLKIHAETLVPHDGFDLAVFDEHGALAGRYSGDGIIDGFNTRPGAAELAVVKDGAIILADGNGRTPMDVTAKGSTVRLDTVRNAYMPVYAGDMIVAVVTIKRRIPGYTPEELDALAALCQQGGIAIGRARLFNQVLSAKREWERVFDATAEGLALIDEKGRVRRCNSAFASLAGMSLGSTIGQDHHGLRGIGIAPGPDCAICNAIRTGARGERVVESAQGRMLKLTLSPYPTGGAVLVAQDITAESQVRGAQQQLFESEKFAAIGRLAAGVSHEVNNPLMGITGLATVLLDDAQLAGENREIVALIQRESRRAAQITRDLLSFVRAEDGARVSISLNDIAQEVAELRRVAHESAGITMKLDLADDLPPVWASHAQLVQVVVNLVTNAEDAVEAHDRREIRISTVRGSRKVCLRVEDSGPGIPEELRARLFEPFFTTKAPGKGTGLGLSLSFSIAERHSGSLRAENVPGGGARFTIELPVAEARAAA